MALRPDSPEQCAYLHPRSLDYCLAPSVMVVTTAVERGTCRDHVTQVVRATTEDYTVSTHMVPIAVWQAR